MHVAFSKVSIKIVTLQRHIAEFPSTEDYPVWQGNTHINLCRWYSCFGLYCILQGFHSCRKLRFKAIYLLCTANNIILSIERRFKHWSSENYFQCDISWFLFVSVLKQVFVEGRTGVFSWCVISWFYFPWNVSLGNYSSWSVIWKFCVTREELELLNDNREFTSVFYVILRRESSGPNGYSRLLRLT